MGEKEKMEAVPYIVHESVLARAERHSKRVIFALVVAIVLLFASNAVWLYCWMQYDYVSDTITVDSNDGGNANYIGERGNIYNGKDNSDQAPQD